MPTTIISKTRYVRITSSSPSSSFSDANSQVGGTLIVQFTLPSAASEGVITGARLKLSYSGATRIYNNYVHEYESAWSESGSNVCCYKSSDTSTLLTYNNYENYGQVSAPQSLGINHNNNVVNQWTNSDGSHREYPYHSGTLNVDVAGLINGNIENNVIGFIIRGAAWANASSSSGMQVLASSFSNPTLEITYEAPSAKTPTISFPSDVYIKQGAQINLSWLYNASGSATQASATVEYHDSTTSSFTVASVTGAGTTYTIPVTLAQGLVTWRVKTTDSNGNTSEYATATFTIIGKPQAPIINEPINSALTTISWTAVEQLSYKLSLYKGDKLLDSIEGSDERRTYSPNCFLSNGSYTFKIAVSNSAGIWSDEASKMFTINVTAPAVMGDIAVENENNEAKIVFADSSQGNENLLDNPFFTVNQRGGKIAPIGTTYFAMNQIGQPTPVASGTTDRVYSRSRDLGPWCTLIIDGTEYATLTGWLVDGYVGNTYTVDRWHLLGATSSVQIIPNGIRLVRSGVNLVFRQLIYDVNAILGKIVTLSVKTPTQIVSRQIQLPNTLSTFDSLDLVIANNWYADIVSNGFELVVRIYSIADSSLDVEAIKLEVGNTSTLANDVAPNYYKELRKCKLSHADASDTYANQEDSSSIYGANLYVTRNGNVIGQIERDEFIDREVAPNRNYEYALRVFDGNGYADSNAVNARVNFKGCYLTSKSDTLHLLYSEQNFMPLSDKPQHTKAMITCVGRTYPITEIGTEKARAITRQCVLTSVEEYEKLLELEEEKDLVYQGSEGISCHVTITDISTSRYMNKGFVIQITMQQVDSDAYQINSSIITAQTDEASGISTLSLDDDDAVGTLGISGLSLNLEEL